MLSDLQTPGTGRHSDFTMKLIKPELKILKSLKINAEIWATAEVGSPIMDSFENIICGLLVMKVQAQELEMEAKEAKWICVIKQ